MTPNQHTVAQFMDGFNRADHAAILACLTDDVIWFMPGAFHHTGKEAFAKEIHNEECFVGAPTIVTTRVTEENDVVVSEGTVTSARKEGGMLTAVFCDVFVMHQAKIKHLTSYLMEVPPKP